jgi:hypothetical protein
MSDEFNVVEAKASTGQITDLLKKSVSQHLTVLCEVKELEAVMKDIENFDDDSFEYNFREDPELSSRSAALLNYIQLIQDSVEDLEILSRDLFDLLGYEVLWDDKRRKWVIDE